VKRALFWLLAALVLVMIVVVVREPVFWKRYALATIHAAPNLPESFYEPSELVAGTDEGEPPRVQPELEHLDAGALRAAADYAGKRHTNALIIGRHGHIVFEQYWDGGRFDAITDADAFTATLGALMVGIAMRDRQFGIVDEPISNYIESLRGTPNEAITIADLLHGASGLAPTQPGWSPWSPSLRERYGRNLLASCLSRELVHGPGRQWAQQPCDTQLLARVIELATHERYAGYISQRLWKPIGAADAWLTRDDEAGATWAHCCLRARRGDWMRIGELLVSDGHFQGEEILPPGWVGHMLAGSKAHPNFGYQVWRGQPYVGSTAPGSASEPYAADDTYFLKGAGKSRLWFVPSLSLTILRMGSNAEDDVDWDDARIPNLVIRGATDFVPPVPKSGAEDVRSLVPNH
jgi:CubicO group peptidase (beta-lactamase class C family)